MMLFVKTQEVIVSLKQEVASEAHSEVVRLRADALADIRARLGRLVSDIERASQDASVPGVSLEQLMLAGWQVEDVVDDLLHDLRHALAGAEHGDDA